ncbi:MAG: MATE family efflux transporter [Clostridiales bacterium]|nr:MATE family efflux transporter [Clostridiales bacterium]
MNRYKIIMQDKTFLRKALMITVPVALQNLLNNVLNLVDTLMIGQLGETTVAAIGLANKVFFVYSLLLFGICSGSGILAAQYWGKRDFYNIRRVLSIAILLGLGASSIFLLPSLFCPEVVMKIFTPQAATISIGADYLTIVALSYPITAVTMAYVSVLRSMNYVKIPVIMTSISILVNAILNYILIFGKLGFPVMGVKGAALATLIARIVECSSLLILVHRNKVADDGLGDLVHYKRDPKDKDRYFNKPFLMKFFLTASPVIANEFMWGLGVTMYSLVYGRMGDAATAAVTITNTVEQVILVFFFGVCSAASVILGNELGANELEKAEEYAKNFIAIQFLLTLLGSLLTLLIKEPIINLFAVSETVANYIRICLTVFAIAIPIRMQNALFIVAILRSGGDTKAALLLDVTAVWLIGIPMAVLGGLILDLPVFLVYSMILVEEVYKLIFSFRRYKQKRWLRNIVA